MKKFRVEIRTDYQEIIVWESYEAETLEKALNETLTKFYEYEDGSEIIEVKISPVKEV